MTKSAKFNSKLPSRMSIEVKSPLFNDHKGSHKEGYTTPEPDTTTTLATMKTLLNNDGTTVTAATTTTTTASSSSARQIAITGQTLHETSPTWLTKEWQRFDSESVHRSSRDTPRAPALIGDNYDVVIRTTDTPVSIHKSTETIGVAGTNNVQITVHHGDINNDSKTLKYVRIESSASKHHRTTAQETTATIFTEQQQQQHTEHVSSNTAGLHAEHGPNHNYNNLEGEVQKATGITLNIRATISPDRRTDQQQQQYIPNPSSISNMITSSTNAVTINTSSSSSSATSTSNNKNPIIQHLDSTRMPTSSHLERTHSNLLASEDNQLKLPALLASSTRTLHRQARQVEEEPIDKCRLFEQGDPEKMELYSPDYPNVYPKNINCTRVITGEYFRISNHHHKGIRHAIACL